MFLRLTILAALAASASLSASKIRVNEDGWFIDGAGRTRIFRGLNAIRKEKPWYIAELLDEKHLDFLKESGFTAMRLGAMWSGYEPSEGRWNQTYAKIQDRILAGLGKRGILSILDFHQDGLSSEFDSYDAIPHWLLAKMDHKAKFPSPLKRPLNPWPLRYLAEDVSYHFQQLYHNAEPAKARDYFVNYWSTLAKMYRANPNVLGYELINEPFAGYFYEDPLLLLPGNAGRLNLQPFYEAVQKGIRQSDNETIIFYEPVTWADALGGKSTGTGFVHVPGGDEYKDRSSMSYHYYCWPIVDQHKPLSPLYRTICNEVVGPDSFKTVQNDRKALGGGTFLTEFCACQLNANKDSCRESVDFTLKTADQYLQSWTVWSNGLGGKEFYSDFAKRKLNENMVKVFIRPYPRATAGVPLSFEFDPNTLRTKFVFELNSAVTAPTEVFVPAVHYPKFAVVSSADFLKASWVDVRVVGIKAIKMTPPKTQCCVGILPISSMNATVCPNQRVLAVF